MSETRLVLCCPAQFAQDAQNPFPGKAPQAKDDAHALEQRQLFHEIGKTVITLFDGRPISRRGTAHARRDVTIAQPEAVFSMAGCRLIRIARAMKRAE